MIEKLKVTNKKIYVILSILFLLSIFPIIVLAFYNYPCADDFSASNTVHLAWIDTKSIIEVFKAAWGNVIYNYKEWSGVFMSTFWTSLQLGIFGEKYYGIVTVLTIVFLVLGGVYLGHVIFDKYLKIDRYISRCIILSYLFMSIQCMPDGNEGLYWHAGAVNYTWAFAFLLMLSGVILSSYIEQSYSKKIIKIILASLLAVCVGGGNYITALQGCIWLVLFFVLAAIRKKCFRKENIEETKNSLVWQLIPGIVLIGAFVISVLAPGNKVRSALFTGFGAIKSVVVSFYYFLNDPFEKWIRWPIVIIMAFTIPFMWQGVKQTKFSFKYPGIVAMLGICIVSAGYTPSLYAQGKVGAGRLDDTVFLIWVIMFYVVTFYILGWLRKQMEESASVTKFEMSGCMKKYITGLLILGIMFTGLAVKVDESVYIGSSAAYSIISGQAEIYRNENEQRIQMLQSKEENVTLKSYSNPPDLLLFQDITMDENEWINQAMAEYYGKESVKRE